MTFAAAVPGPQGQPLDQIRLDGVSATGHHGVLPHERTDGQVFRADVVLHLDTRSAASSDDLAATVSYADVAQDVHDVLAGSPADLVETVAERIAAVVLERPAVHAVDVRVHKPHAPIEVPFDDVSVVVRRDRSHAPVVDPVVEPVAEPLVEPVASPAFQAEPAAVPAPVAGPVPPAAPPAPAVDPLDAAPEQPVEAVLALGANLGDAQVTLREAVTDIDRVPGVQVTDVSPLARTAAVGPEQPDFLNAVLIVRTTLAPRDLLRAVQDVEDQHGRVREERWGPRTLDVDIVQYGTLTSTEPDLELPHPRARERAFVLVPWAEVAPDAVLGGLGGGVVGQLAVTAPDRAGIRWLALDWLTGPTQSTGQVATDSAPALSAPVPQASAPVASEPPVVAHEPQAPAQPQAPSQPPAPEQQTPEAYAPQPYVPEQYTPEPEHYTPEPEPYAPRPYAPSGETPQAQSGPVAEPPYSPQPVEPSYSAQPVEPSYSPQPVEPSFPSPPEAEAPYALQPAALPQRSPAENPPERPQPVFQPRPEVVPPDQVPPPVREQAPAGPVDDVPSAPAPVEPSHPGTGGLVSGVPADLSPHAPVPPAPPEADVFPPYGGEPAQANPFPPFGATGAGQGAGHDEERDEGRDR